jgi:hypothetical protein
MRPRPKEAQLVHFANSRLGRSLGRSTTLPPTQVRKTAYPIINEAPPNNSFERTNGLTRLPLNS